MGRPPASIVKRRNEGNMTHSSTTMPRVATYNDLEQHGFSAEQITRLDQLRACYPHLEFTDGIEEWRRLNFLKWRHTTGRVSE
jgi:hypothetical protein